MKAFLKLDQAGATGVATSFLRRLEAGFRLGTLVSATVRHFIGSGWARNESAGRHEWAGCLHPILRRVWCGARLAAALWFLWPSQAGHAQTNGIQSQIPAVEYNALIDFYNSTDGPSWIDNTGWTNGTSVFWTGLGVNSGHVVNLTLRENGLSGTIPDSLTNLTQLSVLDLRGNQLGGPIPDSLADLTQLGELDLHANQLTGNIPDSLGNLANLYDLELDSNQLSGSIPDSLGNLSRLYNLYLFTNQLSGGLPSSLGNLVNLKTLLLFHNQLNGPIPTNWGEAKLQSILDLELQDNQLSGSVPDNFGNLVSLNFLIMSNNQLTGNIPLSMGDLADLEVLDLQGNQLSGSIPDTLGNLRNLGTLRLNENQLSGPIPDSFGGLRALTDIEMQDNQLSGSIPPGLGNAQYLSTLDLENNQLSGEVPYFPGLTGGELNVTNNYLDITAGSQSLSNIAIMAGFNVGDQIFFTPQNPLPNLVLGPILLLTGGAAQVGLTGLPGRTCAIQTSADLLNWSAFATVALTNMFTQFLDPSATNHPSRFYRAVVSP